MPRTGALREALSFLTPFPGARLPGPRALRWFPAVGAAMGGALGTLWWAAARAWPQPVAAVIVVGADLALTGMLHLDGLADSADGLLAPMERGRRLEVMRDPSVGAFGMGTVAVVLLARWAVFATVAARPGAILLVAALWCVSRTTMAACLERVPYARADASAADASPSGEASGGLASAFMGERLPAWAVGTSVGVAAAAAGFWALPAGPVAIVAELTGAAAVIALAVRRVGGFTGDVLGAAGMIGETVGLIVASAKW